MEKAEEKKVVEETKPQQKEDKKDNKGGDKKNEKKQQNRKKREEKYDFNRENVTLETPVPEVPHAKERVTLPDESQMEKRREVIQKKIDDLYAQKRNYIEKLITESKQNKTERRAGNQSLRDELTEANTKKEKVQTEFNAIKAKSDEIKAKIELKFQETQKIRRSMKQIVKKDQLEALISEKKAELNNSVLSLGAEKKLISEIESLKKSLPLAEKLYPLEKEIDELTDQKRVFGKQMKELFPELQSAREKTTEIIKDLDELRKLSTEKNDTIEPLIQEKKAEIQGKIEKLREEQKAILKDYKAQQSKFYEQKDLLRYVDWLKKQKERLRKDAARAKQQEKRALREKEEAEEEKAYQEARANSVYQEEIELCNQLINFCKYQEKKLTETAEAQATTEAKEINLDSLQKDKLTVIKNRKDLGDDDFLSGNKGKKGKKRNNKQAKNVEEEKPAEKTIQLGYQDLSDFSNCKINPPRTLEDIPKVIKQLEEKKEYYENIPQEEKLKLVEQQEAEKDQEEAGEVKVEKRGKQQVVTFDNEEEYPDL